MIIDCDTHLFEPADMWDKYADPKQRHLALRLDGDELGYQWLMWGDRKLSLAEPHRPGDVDAIGRHRRRWLSGERSDIDYQELSATYSDPDARLRHLDGAGLDAAVLFPNYGIIWERHLEHDLAATLTNMEAWNRWIVDVAGAGGGRLFPVAHVTLRDLGWLEAQLAQLSSAGIRLALIPPALVDGRPMSHPDLNRAWTAFVDHGITPVFHVANQPRPFDDAWFGEEVMSGIQPLQTAFLWTAVALALTDMILGGVLERHPDLRLGIMELSAVWVPLHLMMMDGGFRFASSFNGEVPGGLELAPSEYFRRQVRVAAFSYERPDKLANQAGDIFMACSDYPHTEGTATPLEDYKATRSEPHERPALFGDNVSYLLRQDA